MYCLPLTCREEQLQIAHRLVAESASREEMLQLKSSARDKDAQLKKLQAEVNLERGQLTPRPNFFRASEHVSLKNSQDLPRRSKDVVDDLVDKLNFTCHRAEHLEQQLDRPFQKIDVLHVDWFSLEPTHHKTRVESLFASYCRPSKARVPVWLNDDRRARMLSACRMSARRFQKFVVEFEVNQKLSLDECRQAFTQSGSGSPVLDLSFVEFTNCWVRLAIKINHDEHNTHEDIRGLLRTFNQQFHFDDGRAFNNKLIALERKRADEPNDLTVKSITAHLQGVPVDDGIEEYDADETTHTAEAQILRLARARHLQIMEAAATGYHRSAEKAAWLSDHPSPRAGISMGKIYMRTETKGGKWSDKPRHTIFEKDD